MTVVRQRGTAARRASGWLAAVLLLGACGERGAGEASAREVRVAAAASLTNAFTDLERAFEAVHADLDVVLNLAASSALREQVLGGAPIDVFASADLENIRYVVEGGHVAGATHVFAGNRLVIAVPRGNPAGVATLADLADPERLVGLCIAGVPCGDYARQALARAGVTAAADTFEPNVRALLTKIAAAELDVGIVYATDVAASDAVDGIELPAHANVRADYAIAVLADAPNAAGATAFVEFVLSAEGRRTLQAHGFTPP